MPSGHIATAAKSVVIPVATLFETLPLPWSVGRSVGGAESKNRTHIIYYPASCGFTNFSSRAGVNGKWAADGDNGKKLNFTLLWKFFYDEISLRKVLDSDGSWRSRRKKISSNVKERLFHPTALPWIIMIFFLLSEKLFLCILYQNFNEIRCTLWDSILPSAVRRCEHTTSCSASLFLPVLIINSLHLSTFSRVADKASSDPTDGEMNEV